LEIETPMKIKLWGVRGSIPTTGADTEFYGGNTSCVTVSYDDYVLVLDGGTGIRQLTGNYYPPHKRVDILLTHLHLDHLQGLGFFSPLFDASKEIHIWGPSSPSHSLFSRLCRYLSPPLFPVLLRDLPCKLELHDIGNSEFEAGPFHIQSDYLIHPGPTVGYRITSKNAVLAFMPDHEPALGEKGMIKEKKWISGVDLANGADILIHDSQYTQEEYLHRKGWGHSSISDACLFASFAEVKKVLLSHHDPSHTDTFLNDMFASFKKSAGNIPPASLAKEGAEFELP
jgi:phosphoribosyl 1,2-cyclic phosphodiesterase